MFDFYTRFYRAVATSAANAEYCERVYGRNLCQHGFADVPHLDHLIEVSGIAAGTAVLDLGCGNGMIAETISDRTGAHVTGIDFVERAIRDAQTRTAAKRDRLTFYVMDMSHLDFPPASFDVVVSVDTLYFTDICETLRPIIPMLRAGGRFVRVLRPELRAGQAPGGLSQGPDCARRHRAGPGAAATGAVVPHLGLHRADAGASAPAQAGVGGAKTTVRSGGESFPLRKPSGRGERH